MTNNINIIFSVKFRILCNVLERAQFTNQDVYSPSPQVEGKKGRNKVSYLNFYRKP